MKKLLLLIVAGVLSVSQAQAKFYACPQASDIKCEKLHKFSHESGGESFSWYNSDCKAHEDWKGQVGFLEENSPIPEVEGKAMPGTDGFLNPICGYKVKGSDDKRLDLQNHLLMVLDRIETGKHCTVINEEDKIGFDCPE